MRAACANKSKDGLEQRIRRDAKKWPHPSDLTQHGAVSGKANLRVAVSYPTSLDFLQYSSLFILFSSCIVHRVKLSVEIARSAVNSANPGIEKMKLE